MTNDKDREDAKKTAREILTKYKVYSNFDVPDAASAIELYGSRIRTEAVQAEREKIAILEARIAELTKPYKPNYPEAKAYISEGPGFDSFLSDDQEATVCTWTHDAEKDVYQASCGWRLLGQRIPGYPDVCPNCGKPVKEEGRG